MYKLSSILVVNIVRSDMVGAVAAVTGVCCTRSARGSRDRPIWAMGICGEGFFEKSVRFCEDTCKPFLCGVQGSEKRRLSSLRGFQTKKKMQ